MAKVNTYRIATGQAVARHASTQAHKQPLVGDETAAAKQLSGQKQRVEPIIPMIILAIIGIPPLTYYYWKYRDAHMREKKTAILRDLQARAARGE